VVPRAAHGVAAEQTFGQRPAVVRAGRADRQQFITAPEQQHRLAMRVAEQGGFPLQVTLGDSGFQIGAGELGVVSTHAP
jgi:hypothetical protein